MRTHTLNYPIDATQITTFPDFASQPHYNVAAANYLYKTYGTTDVLALSGLVDSTVQMALAGYTEQMMQDDIYAVWGYIPVAA